MINLKNINRLVSINFDNRIIMEINKLINYIWESIGHVNDRMVPIVENPTRFKSQISLPLIISFHSLSPTSPLTSLLLLFPLWQDDIKPFLFHFYFFLLTQGALMPLYIPLFGSLLRTFSSSWHKGPGPSIGFIVADHHTATTSLLLLHSSLVKRPYMSHPRNI
jgi:hypothetical protein